MTEEERKRVVEIIFNTVAGRVPIIVQVGAPSTRTAVNLAKHAESLGAAAVASVIPFYYSGFAYNETHIIDHFEELVKSIKIPVYLYNNPKTTGYCVSPSLLLKLAEIGVSGLKDSSGDFMLFAEYIREVGEKYPNFNFMIGTVGLLYPALLLGAKSCVAGTANVFPEIVIETYKTILEGNHTRAAELQLTLIEIRKLQAIEGFRPSACYSMLRMRGIDCGTCRKPWRELSPTNYHIVENRLKALGLL
jgi:N-acetylneuraminate lyase/4-hydroxy-tetrahydrodipicolinate synthase